MKCHYLIAQMMGDIPLSSLAFTSTPSSSTSLLSRSITPKLASLHGSLSMLAACEVKNKNSAARLFLEAIYGGYVWFKVYIDTASVWYDVTSKSWEQ